MRKNVKLDNNTIAIISLSIIIIMLLIVIFCLLIKPPIKIGEAKDDNSNKYIFEKNTGEIKGTSLYSSSELSKERCTEGICVSEVTFYYRNKKGRIDYNIVNKNAEVASGYLEANFGFVKLILPYSELAPNVVVDNSSYYEDVNFERVDDYQLRILSEEEANKQIIK